MANTMTVIVTAPRDLREGETFEVEVMLPEKVKKQRGQLAGIPITEMTDEQLKRELINANSVLYKAKQRCAATEVIEANQARVDAAKAEKARRNPAPAEAPVAPADESESVYDESTADEI